MLRKRTIDQLEDTTTLASTVRHVPLDESEKQFPPDFSPRLKTLFQRIQRRGQEPLFPTSWQLDFLNLPTSLFMHPLSDQDYAPIRAMSARSSSEFRGKLAMEKLLCLGRDVREQLQDSRRENGQIRASYRLESIVIACIKRYMNWTSTDGQLEPDALGSCLTLCSLGKRGDAVDTQDAFDKLTDKTTNQLRKMAKTYREAASRLSKRSKKGFITSLLWKSTREHDGENMMAYERAMSRTVYGLAICGPRVVIVALNIRDASSPIRTLVALDFFDAKQDLWSVLAIILTVCAAREECLDETANPYLNDKSLQLKFSSMFVDAIPLDEDL